MKRTTPRDLWRQFWLLVTYNPTGLLIETISFGALLSIPLFNAFSLIFSFAFILFTIQHVMKTVLIKRDCKFRHNAILPVLASETPPIIRFIQINVLLYFMVMLKVLANNFCRPPFISSHIFSFVNFGVHIILFCSSKLLFSTMLIINCKKQTHLINFYII